MSRWWTWSTVAKSRSLNASSPFFMSASRRVVRLWVSVVVAIVTPFRVHYYFSVYSNNLGSGLFRPAAGTSGLWSRERLDAGRGGAGIDQASTERERLTRHASRSLIAVRSARRRAIVLARG